jgi:hypothetical protein
MKENKLITITPEPRLEFCKNCNQMTNHGCRKCAFRAGQDDATNEIAQRLTKALDKKIDTATDKEINEANWFIEAVDQAKLEERNRINQIIKEAKFEDEKWREIKDDLKKPTGICSVKYCKETIIPEELRKQTIHIDRAISDDGKDREFDLVIINDLKEPKDEELLDKLEISQEKLAKTQGIKLPLEEVELVPNVSYDYDGEINEFEGRWIIIDKSGKIIKEVRING